MEEKEVMRRCSFCEELNMPAKIEANGVGYCVGCSALRKFTDSDKDFLKRAKVVGITDNWPYGPNTDPQGRIKLVNWAETMGFEFCDYASGFACVEWLFGIDCCTYTSDCAWGSGSRDGVRGTWFDHVTCWKDKNGSRYLLAQPYQDPDSVDLAILNKHAGILEVSLSARAPWYGFDTMGVLVKGPQIGYGVLYRFFDETRERLLYTGESKTKIERIASHCQDNWWKEAVWVKLEHFPTKEAAKLAEEAAIKTENPKYNVKHNVLGVGV